ncbi:MAG TPA: glycosyltransferase family 39 protein [Candidatus Udaeobacter sp.]|nr:glycosyltransferase family 39 protein [Candidatus Udaeobacter sp.]
MRTSRGASLPRFGLTDTVLPLISVVLPLLVWCARYIGQDLWWDEITSLIYYSLQPLKETVRHLESTNNHIFFNLLINVFTRLIGERDFYVLMDRVPLLRGLQLAFGVVSVVITYVTGRRFFSPGTGWAAALILTTTIPFLNFVEQLRGYILSMMLVVLALFHVWSYESRGRERHLFGLLIAIFCLVYTVLSNAYFVLVLGLIYVVQWLRGGETRPAALRILITFFAAVVALVLVYVPVWEDFRQVYARMLGAAPPYRTFVLQERLPQVLWAFLSFRFVLPILVVTGGVFLFRSPPTRIQRRRFIDLLALLVVPFLISFGRNELPYDRTFVHLAPIFALLAGVAIVALLHGWRFLWRRPLVWSIVLYLYCAGTLVYGHRLVQERLAGDLLAGRRDQDVLYNYYLSDVFTPGADTRRCVEQMGRARRPVIGVDDVDRFATGFYFNRLDVTYYTTVALEELGPGSGGNTHYRGTYQRTNGRQSWPPLMHTKLEFDLPAELEGKEFRSLHSALRQNGILREHEPDFYVVTPFADRFTALVERSYPQFRLQRLSDRVTYLNLFAVYDSGPVAPGAPGAPGAP